MAQYIGYNSINRCKPSNTNRVGASTGGISKQELRWKKKFKLTDERLVVQDYINAMNIRQGQKVGQPGYGTRIWDFLFEPNTRDVQAQIQDELRKLASLDPRLIINNLSSTYTDDGILVEIELAIKPFNNAELLRVFFDRNSGTATAS